MGEGRAAEIEKASQQNIAGKSSDSSLILGIETSCDETAAAILDGNAAREQRVLGHSLLSQIDIHALYGGVVPEIAARAHIDHLDRLIREAMQQAGLEAGPQGFAALSAVAATTGPGLIGGVMVGSMTGKAIALAARKPFLGVNHLEGHALSARLEHDTPFPFLLMLMSGGHCQILAVLGVGHYRRLGTTLDDAIGEAFDKTAKMMGLGYPGGPLVEQAALRALARNPDAASRFAFPRPMVGRPGCDFSFSGLKTAVRQAIEKNAPCSDEDIEDLCAAFQQTAADVLANRLRNASAMFRELLPPEHQGKLRLPLVLAGGVAANRTLRSNLETAALENGLELQAPSPWLCTDNAAMIAWAGWERFRLGQSDGLDIAPRPRWPLDPEKG